MDDVSARVSACFQIVFPYLDADRIPQLDKAGLDEWDSLASISLVTVLEEEFEVEFDDDAVDGLTNFPAVVDAVTARVG